MRRLAAPLVLLLLTAVVGMLAFGLVSGEESSAKKAAPTATTANRPTNAQLRADGAAANAALLATVPLPAGSGFVTKNDAEQPRGGTHITTYSYFAFPGDRAALIAHFRASLKDWTFVGELTVPSRTVAKFQKGDAWLEVVASPVDIAGKASPGFTLMVNAKDAKLFAAL